MSLRSVTSLPIRRLTIDDLPNLLLLAQDRGWSPEEGKYRLLFEVGEVFGVDDPEDGLAASVTGTRYGDRVTAISMMLVAERHGRRGLGGRLMRHAMQQPGVVSACLTATEYGRPLYTRLGFRTLGLMSTFRGHFVAQPGDPDRELSRPTTPSDLPAILALDGRAFGAPRSALVTRLLTFSEQFRVVDGPDGGLAGFAGVWRNIDAAMIGPVVARDAESALALAFDLARTAEGPLRMDLDHRSTGLIAWAKAHGLKRTATTTVMEYGEPIEGDPSLLFAPVMQALG